jgi:hypothetical protein
MGLRRVVDVDVFAFPRRVKMGLIGGNPMVKIA